MKYNSNTIYRIYIFFPKHIQHSPLPPECAVMEVLGDSEPDFILKNDKTELTIIAHHDIVPDQS